MTTTEETTPEVTDTPSKRPATADRKPSAKRVAKPKVKTIMGDDTEGKKVPVGREVTLHGVTVTVLDSSLGDFEIVDDLSLLGEAFEASQHDPDGDHEELLAAASNRVSPLLRRLVGIQGSREVLTALRYEHGGKVEFEHALEFIGELMAALSPNS